MTGSDAFTGDASRVTSCCVQMERNQISLRHLQSGLRLHGGQLFDARMNWNARTTFFAPMRWAGGVKLDMVLRPQRVLTCTMQNALRHNKFLNAASAKCPRWLYHAQRTTHPTWSAPQAWRKRHCVLRPWCDAATPWRVQWRNAWRILRETGLSVT